MFLMIMFFTSQSIIRKRSGDTNRWNPKPNPSVNLTERAPEPNKSSEYQVHPVQVSATINP